MEIPDLKAHRFFYYLLLLLTPVQLGYHLWPSWAIVLGRRVDYLSPTLYLTDVLIFLVVICWFYREREMFRRFMTSLKRHPPYVYVATFLILFLVASNILLSAIPQVSAYQWLKICEFFLLALYIRTTRPNLTRSMLVLTVAAVLEVVLAFWQVIIQHSVGGILWFFGERTFSSSTIGIALSEFCLPGKLGCITRLRPYGTFPHPNVLAGFLVMVLLELTAVPRMQWNRFSRVIGHLFPHPAQTVLVLGIILTLSRSAWIALGICGIICTIISVFNRNRTKKIRYVTTAVPPVLYTGLLLSVIFLGIGTLRIYQDVYTNSESVTVRTTLLKTALRIWQHSPIVGTGLGTSTAVIPSYVPTRQIYILQPVHSVYLLLLAETGLAGLLIFLALAFQGLRHALKLNPITPLPFLSVLIIGLSDHYFLSLHQGLLIFSLAFAFLYIGKPGRKI